MQQFQGGADHWLPLDVVQLILQEGSKEVLQGFIMLDKLHFFVVT
jgi:hypothetical protein